MHKSEKRRVLKGNTGWMGKVAVMGLLDRHGKDGHSTMRTQIVSNTRKHILEACASVFGKRLTYTTLTGKELPQTC